MTRVSTDVVYISNPMNTHATPAILANCIGLRTQIGLDVQSLSLEFMELRDDRYLASQRIQRICSPYINPACI